MDAPLGQVAIGICSNGRPVTLQWALALRGITVPLNTSLAIIECTGKRCDTARNGIVKAALEHGMRFLWCIDDDTVVPAHALEVLLYEITMRKLRGDKVGAIGGIYASKTKVPAPVVIAEPGGMPFWDWKAGDVFKCYAVGAGCLLIDLDVLKTMEPPWFTQGNAETDDVSLCRRLHEHGYDVLAHGGVLCPHVDTSGKQYLLPEDSFPMIPRAS